MRSLALASLVVLALVVAGCATPEIATVEAADGSSALPAPLVALQALMGDVPCEADVGAGTSANLLQLAMLEHEGGAELDIREDGLAMLTTDTGLSIFDLSDPLEMAFVSEIELSGFQTDAKWTASGDGALVGGVAMGHVHLVDLTDPTQPTLRSTLNVSGQGHSLASVLVDGVEWVYISAQTTPHGTHVAKRVGWELEYVGQYRTLDRLSTPLGHHDNTIVVDPLLDNGTYLYVAQGFEGWTVADLADPAAPVKVGGPLLPELGPGYTHMLRVAFMDGKRIVVSMQEAGLNTLNIWDATDLARPQLLARWNADAVQRHLPQHNLQILGDHLYLAHYELGFFVFDLAAIVAAGSPVANLGMRPVAHYAVDEVDVPTDTTDRVLRFSDIIDLQILDGVLYVNDREDGLLSFGFGCLPVGDPAMDALI